MSRFAIAGALAILAAASTIAAAGSLGEAIAESSVRAWSIAGFVVLRTAVLFAVSVCVFARGRPRRHSRSPIAFAACAVALSAVPLLEKPAATHKRPSSSPAS